MYFSPLPNKPKLKFDQDFWAQWLAQSTQKVQYTQHFWQCLMSYLTPYESSIKASKCYISHIETDSVKPLFEAVSWLCEVILFFTPLSNFIQPHCHLLHPANISLFRDFWEFAFWVSVGSFLLWGQTNFLFVFDIWSMSYKKQKCLPSNALLLLRICSAPTFLLVSSYQNLLQIKMKTAHMKIQ